MLFAKLTIFSETGAIIGGKNEWKKLYIRQIACLV
jgi:hypothetical protein